MNILIKNSQGDFIKLHYKTSVLKRSTYNILLCHGFGSSKLTFDPIFLDLSSMYKCYAIDLPGHGDTKGIKKDMKLPFLANSLKQFIDALRLDNVILIGHSLGGGVVSYLWNDKRIKSFVFIAPINPAIVTKEKGLKNVLLPSTLDELKESWKRLIQDFTAVDPHFFSKENAIFTLKKVEKFRFLHESLALDVWKRRRQWEIAYNYLSIQKKCKVIFGDNDSIIPTKKSIDWLSKLLKNVSFSTIENCGHVPHYERSKETLSILLRFISSL